MVPRPQRTRAEAEGHEDSQNIFILVGICMFIDSHDLGQKDKLIR